MHLKGELNVRDPAGCTLTRYVMREIIDFLRERTGRARAHRRAALDAIVLIDPGLEFGKEPRAPISRSSGPVRRRTGANWSYIRFSSPARARASSAAFSTGRVKELLCVPSLATSPRSGIAAGA